MSLLQLSKLVSINSFCLNLLTSFCSSHHFFFSSRRRHTRSWRDWSSDVCSSDLDARNEAHRSDPNLPGRGWSIFVGAMSLVAGIVVLASPVQSIVTLALVVGVWFVVIGVFEIASDRKSVV